MVAKMYVEILPFAHNTTEITPATALTTAIKGSLNIIPTIIIIKLAPSNHETSNVLHPLNTSLNLAIIYLS